MSTAADLIPPDRLSHIHSVDEVPQELLQIGARVLFEFGILSMQHEEEFDEPTNYLAPTSRNWSGRAAAKL
jgi:hypothetical protein